MTETSGGSNVLQEALPASYYVDDAHWQRERDRVLHRSWFCVGRLSTLGLAVEGDDQPRRRRVVVDVAGESVVVTRDDEGALHAFYNVCRHRGSQVVSVDDAAPAAARSLRCPYHSWTNDHSGRLLRAPHGYASCAARRTCRLRPPRTS